MDDQGTILAALQLPLALYAVTIPLGEIKTLQFVKSNDERREPHWLVHGEGDIWQEQWLDMSTTPWTVKTRGDYYQIDSYYAPRPTEGFANAVGTMFYTLEETTAQGLAKLIGYTYKRGQNVIIGRALNNLRCQLEGK